MITVYDVVHIIQEEAGEDITRLSGAGDGDINRPFLETVKTRQTWLIVNFGTALLASGVVSLFQDTISRLVGFAVLMPFVAPLGGNAGPQTMAVRVRAPPGSEGTTFELSYQMRNPNAVFGCKKKKNKT